MTVASILLVGCIGKNNTNSDTGDIANTTYSVSGTVVDLKGNGVSNVLLNIDGVDVVVTSDADGNWALHNIEGEIIIKPVLDQWVFKPSHLTIDKKTNNIIFTGEPTFSIQNLIDSADGGDTIIIPPGNYYENIDFKGKNIIVQSIDPFDPRIVASTVISGDGRGPVVTFRNGEDEMTSISGFTLKNGFGKHLEGFYCGGGVYIENSSPTISNNLILDNWAERGSAIYVYGLNSSPEITENTISRNRGEEGVVYYSSQFENNKVVKVYHNVISDNQSYGVIAKYPKELRIENNEISRNDGGIALSSSNREAVNIESNIIQDNKKAGISVGIDVDSRYMSSIKGVIKDNILEGNSPALDLGFATGHVDVIISGNYFRSNYLEADIWTEGGGAIYFGGRGPSGNLDVSIFVINNTFEDNQSSTDGGAIYFGHSYTFDSIIAKDNRFSNNSSKLNGGAIFTKGYPQLTSNYFNENTSKRGGAIYLTDKIILLDNEFICNYAEENGGAIYMTRTASFDGENIWKDNLPADIYKE